MLIDWAATGSMLTGVGTLASAAAILAAAYFGRTAASDFKSQKRFERQLEFAERALAVAHRLETAIDSIRSPVSTAQEIAESDEELQANDWYLELSEGKKQLTSQANIFYRRIRRFKDDFDEASTLVPFLKAYFSQESGEALKEIIGARHTIKVYADAYAQNDSSDPEFSKVINENIWRGYSGESEDPIGSVVKKAVADLEAELAPFIRTKDA